MDRQAASREKTKANKDKQRRRTETVTETAGLAAFLGSEPADAEFKSRRRNEKQKALAFQREQLSVEFLERGIRKLDREEEAEVEASADDPTASPQSHGTLPDDGGIGSPDAAEEPAETTAPSVPFPKSEKTIDAVLSSDPARLTHERVRLARECADVEEQQAKNRKFNADAEVVEQRAAKIKAEAKKTRAEAKKAQAEAKKVKVEAASEPGRQKIKRADEVVALVMRVVLTVFSMGIVLAGFLVNPLLIPSGAAVAGGAYGVKYWWGHRKNRDQKS
jgi:hypothetical protein